MYKIWWITVVTFSTRLRYFDPYDIELFQVRNEDGRDSCVQIWCVKNTWVYVYIEGEISNSGRK